MASREEIAWAAGLFEGEGCITLSGKAVAVRLVNTDEEVVQRFAEVIGFGTVYGPYSRQYESDGWKRRPRWVWVGLNEDAYEALALMGRWLSARRLARAFDLTGLRFYMESPAHPPENPT
jgi:hypothetical protein